MNLEGEREREEISGRRYPFVTLNSRLICRLDITRYYVAMCTAQCLLLRAVHNTRNNNTVISMLRSRFIVLIIKR